jgi:hypothetical protein
MIRALYILAITLLFGGCSSREDWCAAQARNEAILAKCVPANTCEYIGGAGGIAGIAAEAKIRCEWKDQ